MEVVSVNVGKPRVVTIGVKEVSTGISKELNAMGSPLIHRCVKSGRSR